MTLCIKAITVIDDEPERLVLPGILFAMDCTDKDDQDYRWVIGLGWWKWGLSIGRVDP